jgi:hypothetical protein
MTRFPSRSLPRLTRRRVLAVTATVGVGAATAGVAGIGFARESKKNDGVGALVISLRDAESGTFDLFAGASRLQFEDKDLAAKLIETVRNG